MSDTTEVDGVRVVGGTPPGPAGRMDETAAPEADEFPSSWVISICRTCGRVAQWPFCEHREQPPADGSPWCLPVSVKGSLPAKHRLPAGGGRPDA